MLTNGGVGTKFRQENYISTQKILIKTIKRFSPYTKNATFLTFSNRYPNGDFNLKNTF